MKPLLVDEKERYVTSFQDHVRDLERAGSWFLPTRERAIRSFEKLGFPSTKVEAWKYTDISPILKNEFHQSRAGCEKLAFTDLESVRIPEAAGALLVFIDGHFCSDLSTVANQESGMELRDLGSALVDPPQELQQTIATVAPVESEPFVALNTAMTEDGVFLYVPPDRELEQVVHALFISSASSRPVISHPRVVVVVGRNSRVRLVETFDSASDRPSFTNAVTECVLADGAALTHYRIQRENTDSYHIGSTDVRVGRSANYSAVSIALGAALARHDLRVGLVEEGAECHIDGLYVLDGKQHTDNHTRIDHRVPHCSSSQVYKGVLDGSSRAVFNGKVIVHHDAQKTEAHQTNRNLVLSPTTRVDTKPELEIFADDVVCSHGATVGALEDEEQFYLLSRGIDPVTARGLLTYGFAEEIVDEIRIESLRKRLDETILQRFQQR